jgi:hypothetical protein
VGDADQVTAGGAVPMYRLVGYSETRELGRVRVYVPAEAEATAQSPVHVAPMSAPFDYSGQPLQLRPAPSVIAARVRAHLLRLTPPAYCAAVRFQPLDWS